MFSKVLIQFLCLSLALIGIEAMVRLPTNENELTYDRKEPEPIEDHEHRHHHHHKHHHNQADKPGNTLLPSENMPPPPPHHEMLVRLWPLFKALLNKDYHKSGRIDANDSSKLESQSKTRAFVMSKTNTKYTETEINNNHITNDTKILTKVLEQNGETDAIVDFNSDMDVISDKILKAKSDVESKPIEEKTEQEMPRREFHSQIYPAHNLRRMKREDESENEGKKTWGNIMGAFKKVGEAIKDGYKKHVEEPVKKMVEDWKKKQQAKKAAKKAKGGQTSEAPTEEAHEEK